MMEPSERAIDMLANEIKKLKAENEEILERCHPQDVDALRGRFDKLQKENATLKARVEELEAENENLRIARSVADPVKLLKENAELKKRIQEFGHQPQQPYLGCATTGELLEEIRCRIEIDGNLDYRTIDS